jgi:hypothetical protein
VKQGDAVRANQEVTGFLVAVQRIWFEHFPQFSKRGQAHIVTYLCASKQDGCALGELSGFVKQLFLLDESTIKERIRETERAGFLTLDPVDRNLASRTLILPTISLLDQFDTYLGAVGMALLDAASRLDAAFAAARTPVIRAADVRTRSLLIESAECAAPALLAAFERFFDERNLSLARRLEAKRNLLSASHWCLLLAAIERALDAAGPPAASVDGEDDGILADQLAASLLALIGQNFQTTRDHIAYLLKLGLLERRRGKALRVGLAAAALPHVARALDQVAATLLDQARDLVAKLPATAIEIGRPSTDQTVDIRLKALTAALRHVLVLNAPHAPPRRIKLGDQPVTFGRRSPSDVLLSGDDVSRQHCRIELIGQQARVTDLNSTNGTFVNGDRILGTTALRDGSEIRIGTHLVTYSRRAGEGDDVDLDPIQCPLAKIGRAGGDS